ncbi:thiamine phosphate synthase [Candidatus Poribacteria bacterium]|nr:MAG: thiamine phosphate synthase [Candidatus Poribacteria bacterium]
MRKSCNRNKMIDFNLYVITNRHLCTPKSLLTVVSEILDVGVKAIQLREKDLADVALFKLAKPISDLCQTHNAHLFINTNTKIAVEVGAAGVHLPDIDKSVTEVKAQLGGDFLIGCSIHDVDAAKKREIQGADFITYSPIYPTVNKPQYGPAVGVKNLEKLVKQVHLPVFALGGITPARVGECLGAGASGVAVMSGVMSPIDAAQRAQEYMSSATSL